MPRRGENIYKRKDGRWEGRYIADRKPDGGALYRSVYGTTYADVRQKLAVCREENRKQQFRSCTLTVKELLTHWQAENSHIKPTSRERYRVLIQQHIEPELGDQRMIFGILTMVVTADTKDQLDADTDAILSTARKRMCQMAVLKYQQTDGLNTVLPIGTRKLNAFRTLTTESLAVFMPFKVQEIMDKGGRTPGGITDPEYSISVGIQNLADCLQTAGAESPIDLEHIQLALQGYNFGSGYITWALQKYGEYSRANAIEFSMKMAEQTGKHTPLNRKLLRSLRT